ncbi:MAG TPA: proton-translocating transhydrogenase family protein, partial [Polyangiaceae bacterium]|nr:proton-translocating transhydrogenase family protein [Polyangiaceae bacterium]
ELKWPPPNPPALRAGGPPKAEGPGHKPGEHAHKPASPWPGRLGALAAALLLGLLGVWGSPELLQRMTVFLLACVVGWHVVWNVSAALHTPLMSVTNAVSGIILLGGLLLLPGASRPETLALAAVAVLIAAINVAGGFLVTQRMLRMFRK